MPALCTKAELQRRFTAYERQRTIISAIGFAPFLVIQLLVHTRYLGPWLPQSREAELVALSTGQCHACHAAVTCDPSSA